MARTPDGPPPPPTVQKLRLRYAKRGRLRFSSHRDFQRALERAVRRASVPVAFSAGFNPHPKISYANAAPTGTASEAEYLEISLAVRCEPALVRQALDAALPPGLDVIEVVEAGPGGLVERLEASDWSIMMPGVEPAVLAAAVERFLAEEIVEVERLTKGGIRRFDARAAVLRAVVTDGAASPGTDPQGQDAQVGRGVCAILRVVVRHTTPVVRPDDVLSALTAVTDLAPPSPPLVTRLAQGPLGEAQASVTDPLAADRDIVGA